VVQELLLHYDVVALRVRAQVKAVISRHKNFNFYSAPAVPRSCTSRLPLDVFFLTWIGYM
jgi:hypothetical protein